MYQFRISYLKFERSLGWVACSFRTTADAVEQHKSALAIRRHAGEVSSVVVEAL